MCQVKLMPTVMIAEDDIIMADMLEEALIECGYDVCGIARTVDEAVELGERHKPNLAVLDIRLAGGGLGTDIPARLKCQGRMGVLYASGHADQFKLTKADGDVLLVKPYRSKDVLSALGIGTRPRRSTSPLHMPSLPRHRQRHAAELARLHQAVTIDHAADAYRARARHRQRHHGRAVPLRIKIAMVSRAQSLRVLHRDSQPRRLMSPRDPRRTEQPAAAETPWVGRSYGRPACPAAIDSGQ
jgi:DNA-binding response OmpR family regulator